MNKPKAGLPDFISEPRDYIIHRSGGKVERRLARQSLHLILITKLWELESTFHFQVVYTAEGELR